MPCVSPKSSSIDGYLLRVYLCRSTSKVGPTPSLVSRPRKEWEEGAVVRLVCVCVSFRHSNVIIGFVRNVVAKNFFLDQVDTPVLLFQTYRAPSFVLKSFVSSRSAKISSIRNNTPSRLQFSDLTFEDFSGTTTGATREGLHCTVVEPVADPSLVQLLI
jgi:hypothetical protein